MRGKYDSPPAPMVLVLLHLPLFFSLIVPATRTTRALRHLFFFAALLGGVYIVCFTASASEAAQKDFFLGTSVVSALLTTSDFILLTEPRKELFRLKSVGRAGQKDRVQDEYSNGKEAANIKGKETSAEHISKSNPSLWERMCWAVSLLSSPRGVGWSFEPSAHLPPHPTVEERRWPYVAKQLMCMVLYILLAYMMGVLKNANPRFAGVRFGSGLHELGDGYPFSCWWRLAVWVVIVEAYASMSAIYTVFSVLSVGLGMTEPWEWPALFGSPLEAYTVRRYWGRMWHQLYRRFLTSHASYLAPVLLSFLPYASTLPKNAQHKLSSYTKLYICFLLSGAVHYAGDYMHSQRLPDRGGAMRYFFLHACAITVEDAVIGLGRRMGVRETWAWRVVGYMWVIGWFAAILPDWIDARALVVVESLKEEGK